MGLLNFKKSSPAAHQKNLLINAGDAQTYAQGVGNPVDRTLRSYTQSVQAVETAVNIITSLASTAKFSFWREDKDGKLKRIKVKNINPFEWNDIQSQAGFIKTLVGSLITYGSALVVPEESTAPRRQGLVDFWVFDPNRFIIQTGKKTSIEQFELTMGDGSKFYVKKDDTIYMPISYDPANYMYGVARLKAMNDTIKLYLNQMRFANDHSSKGGKKSGIVSFENPLAPEAIQDIEKVVKTFLNKQETALLMLDQKFKLDLVSDGASIQDVLKFLTYTNDTIMQHYALPPFLRGVYESSLTDKVTRHGAILFFETMLKPIFTVIEQHFTVYFRDVLGIKNCIVKFDYTGIGILEADRSELIDQEMKLLSNGVHSINEVRQTLGDDILEAEAANYHHLAQFVTGSKPISLENWDADVSRNEGQTNEVPNGPGGDRNSEGMHGAV